jgi:magnesium-transporting ATPase (P-type)
MWLNMVMNAFILSFVVIAVYVVALLHFLDDRVLIADLDFEKDEKQLMYARTVAFISLVFCENVRSYTSRSFDKPVWKNICGNKAMHAAIIAAQVALYVAVLTPFLSDQILELDGIEIGAWGWGVAACGPVATLVLCELSKFVTAFQIRQHQRRLAKSEELAQEHKSAAAVEVMDQPARVKSGPLARQDSYNRLNEQNQVNTV